jgi:hypothetical protein
MNISEEELRVMVRAAVARARQEPSFDGRIDTRPNVQADRPATFQSHVSHARLGLVAGGDADGQCLIEPAVRCNHCGYCQSLGH